MDLESQIIGQLSVDHPPIRAHLWIKVLLFLTLTVARLHALGVAVLLRVPGDGAHVGHVVALRVGVGRV